MKILFDNRWSAPNGIGRFAVALLEPFSARYDVGSVQTAEKPSAKLDPLRIAYEFYRGRFDLYFSPGFNGSFPIGRRQVFILHDLTHTDRRGPIRRRILNTIYYNLLYRSAARRAIAVVTVSQFSAGDIARQWPDVADRLTVIPGGVAAEFKPKPVESARAGLVLFSNSRWHKNVPRTLAALRLSEFKGVLYVVGARSAEFEHLVSDAGLKCRVEWVTRPSDEALAQLYHQAKALLFCSITEGFGLPVVEALACGCHVVASDIPAFREVGGEGCVYVDPYAIDSITAGIGVALSAGPIDADAVARYGARTWANVADDFVALLDRIQPEVASVGGAGQPSPGGSDQIDAT